MFCLYYCFIYYYHITYCIRIYTYKLNVFSTFYIYMFYQCCILCTPEQKYSPDIQCFINKIVIMEQFTNVTIRVTCTRNPHQALPFPVMVTTIMCELHCCYCTTVPRSNVIAYICNFNSDTESLLFYFVAGS